MALQEALVSGQQQPGRSQQMRSQQQAAPSAHQLPGIPPAATSQAQISGMQAARQQQPMVQAQLPHMANMGRGTGPSLAGAPSHPMPQGPIKQEGLHPGGLQGQHTMRAASPPMRVMSPAMPGGLTQAQLLQNQHQQQQQAALLHGQQMPGMQLSNCDGRPYDMHRGITPIRQMIPCKPFINFNVAYRKHRILHRTL